MKNWPTGIVASIALVCVSVLSYLHIDTTVIVALVGALLYGEVRTVSVQTNGNTTKLLELLDKLGQRLAESSPPAPAAPAAAAHEGGEQP